MKAFEKGQRVRVLEHGNKLWRIEHMGVQHMGVQGDVALCRRPDGPTTCWTQCSWFPLESLRHADAIDRLAKIETL